MAGTGFYRNYGKRLFDLCLTIPGLIILLPAILVLFIISRIVIGSPVIFRQKRPGRGGEIFEMIKFRSMTNATDAQGNLLPDDQRLPKYGKLLRATSLDELPELWNVVKGEMSLVGPRPLLVQYLQFYTVHQHRRHDAAPGVTGWAQVNGRNAISWEQKFAYDVWYVENMSLPLDIKILWMTIGKVFKRSGVSAQNHATTPFYHGPRPAGGIGAIALARRTEKQDQ